MSIANDGGPAFPDPGRAQSAKQRETLTNVGLSMRDYFAAKAIQGLLANGYVIRGETHAGAYIIITATAYDIADAMLEARKS